MREKLQHRRQAILLAAQLPKGREDALLVLQDCIRLVEMPGFWEALPNEPEARNHQSG